MSRNAPFNGYDVDQVTHSANSPSQRRAPIPSRHHRWDLMVVGVLTPLVAISLFLVAVVGYEQLFPDPYVAPPTAVPGASTSRSSARASPTAEINPRTLVPQQIDVARLNAGVLEKPPEFEWPEVHDLKLVPNPGRPGELADYVPELTSVDSRRLISAMSVSVVMHSSPSFPPIAIQELIKSYPLRMTKRKVLDIEALTGYLPDESGFGVVFSYGIYRVHVETIAGSPPIRQTQRTDLEYQTLHLADHIARRVQELGSSGRRTVPEALAVHWRDHIARSVPGGG